MRHICASIVATLVLAGTAVAATINVPGDYATIQGAVNAANNGDDILVASGIYTSTHPAHVVDTMGKAVFIHAVSGPSVTVIDGQGQRRGVACHSGETLATTLSGFTVRNCFSPDYDYDENGAIDAWEDGGAGIYCLGSSPTITNCLITTNSTGGDDGNPPRGGGGVYCYTNSSPHISNCVVSGNHGNYGGGIYINETCMPIIDSCVIAENTAVDHGAGIYCKGTGAVITNCVVENNLATKRGGGVWFKEGIASMAGCTLVGNQAVNGGGGVFCDDNGSPIITQCTIEWNVAKNNNGGGVACRDNGNPTLRDCSIRFNMTSFSGGGIHCYANSPQIEECVISYNMALDGGGVWSNTSSLTIASTLICENSPNQLYGPWTDGDGNTIADMCVTSGACCTNGVCVVSEQVDCITFNGQWLGDETACDNSPCPTSCLGDVNGDGEVSVNDILTVIGNWGPCP